MHIENLFVKVPQLRDSKVTFSVFESSCHLLLPSNHSKGEAISLSIVHIVNARQISKHNIMFKMAQNSKT